MPKTKEFFPKECEIYDFTWVLLDNPDFPKCLEQIQEEFSHYLRGLENVFCDWNIEQVEDTRKVRGYFDSIREWEHKLKNKLEDHYCGEFIIIRRRI